MDLALLNRIDTDPQRPILIDDASRGEPILDFCLAAIAAKQESMRADTHSHDGWPCRWSMALLRWSMAMDIGRQKAMKITEA